MDAATAARLARHDDVGSQPREAAAFAAVAAPRRANIQILDTPEDEARKRLRLRALSVAEIRAAAAPHWLVLGIVQRGSLVLFWGASGSGKTFAALDMSFSLALGRRWFNRRVRRSGVIYLAGEGHLKARIEAKVRRDELDNADLEGLRAVPSNLNLLDPGADIAPLLASLQEASREMGGVALVVLDTLNAAMPGGDENSSEDMGRMILACRQIMAALDCTVLIVHHCGKDEKGARGHSSLRAAVDTEIVVREQDGLRVLTVEKQRDGETGAEFAFRLVPVDLGASSDPEADPEERYVSCVVEPLDGVPAGKGKPAKRDVALDALHETISTYGERLPQSSTIPPGVRGVRLDQWAARWRLRTGDDYESQRIGDAAFRTQRAALLKAGAIMISDPYVWLAS
jgi:AAA domain